MGECSRLHPRQLVEEITRSPEQRCRSGRPRREGRQPGGAAPRSAAWTCPAFILPRTTESGTRVRRRGRRLGWPARPPAAARPNFLPALFADDRVAPHSTSVVNLSPLGPCQARSRRRPFLNLTPLSSPPPPSPRFDDRPCHHSSPRSGGTKA